TARNGASPFLASFFCGATSSNEMFRNYEQARHCGKKNCTDSVVTPSIMEPQKSESDMHLNLRSVSRKSIF
ncbi:MAG: hypothetical protein LAT79_10595, partial [Kiritimatiellae bacterium]|nr:hypothetical protein [Kiritimatiellia bacterium]